MINDVIYQRDRECFGLKEPRVVIGAHEVYYNQNSLKIRDGQVSVDIADMRLLPRVIEWFNEPQRTAFITLMYELVGGMRMEILLDTSLSSYRLMGGAMKHYRIRAVFNVKSISPVQYHNAD